MEDEVCSSKRPLRGPQRLQSSLNMMDVVRVLELNISLSNRQKENSALRLRELQQLTPATSLPLPATEVALISARRFRDAKQSSFHQPTAIPPRGRQGNYTAMTHGRKSMDHCILAQNSIVTNRSKLLLITGSKSSKGSLVKKNNAPSIKFQRHLIEGRDPAFKTIVSPLASMDTGNPLTSGSTANLSSRGVSTLKRTPIERAVRARSVTYDLRLRERWNQQQSLQELHKHMVTSSSTTTPGRCRTVSDFRPEDGGAIDAVAAINAAMQPTQSLTTSSQVPTDAALRFPAKYLLRSPSSCSSAGLVTSVSVLAPRRVLVRLPGVQDTRAAEAAPPGPNPQIAKLAKEDLDACTASTASQPGKSRALGVTAITAVNIGEVQVPDETLHRIQARVQTPGTLKTYTLKDATSSSSVDHEKSALVNGSA